MRARYLHLLTTGFLLWTAAMVVSAAGGVAAADPAAPVELAQLLAQAPNQPAVPPAVTPERAAELASERAEGARDAVMVALAATAGFTLLLIVYIWHLRHQLLSSCKSPDDLKMFCELPAGVPAGTIRSALALIIVFSSIVFLSLAVSYEELGLRFPEVLSGILGAVLGFYFGNRSGGGDAREALGEVAAAREERERATTAANQAREAAETAQVERQQSLEEARAAAERATTAERQHNDFVMQEQAAKLGSLRTTIGENLETARAVAKVLPPEMGERFERATDIIGQGLGILDTLSQGGRTADAVKQAAELYGRLRQENPIASILSQATVSFARVLGGSMPPLALISLIIGVAARLGAGQYNRWVARVLHAPYTTELFPATVIDGNAALTLIQQTPIFRTALAPELEQGNREFLKQAVHEALLEDGGETLWQRIGTRFESRAQFDEGLAELQRAAIGQEVVKDLPPDTGQELGGIEVVLKAIDKLHEDEEATRDLDALMLAAGALRREGKSPEAVFGEAIKSVEGQ